MGEIPSGPLFSVKRCFALAVLASAAVGVSAGQVTSAQTANNSEQASERKPIGLQQIPVEQKADILMARGEYAAAIVAYRQSNLKSAIVWNNIGMAYHHLFALEEARKAYEQALSINPRFAPASNNLAAVYYGHMLPRRRALVQAVAQTFDRKCGHLLQSGHRLLCGGQIQERREDVSKGLFHRRGGL